MCVQTVYVTEIIQTIQHNVHAFIDAHPLLIWAIYCTSAPGHHVCLHAAPGAEGTLVRDMRNVIRNSGVAVFLPTERSRGWLLPPGISGLLAANEDKS